MPKFCILHHEKYDVCQYKARKGYCGINGDCKFSRKPPTAPCNLSNEAPCYVTDLDIEDIFAWADGMLGACGTEYRDRVLPSELAVANAIMKAKHESY